MNQTLASVDRQVACSLPVYMYILLGMVLPLMRNLLLNGFLILMFRASLQSWITPVT